MQTLKKLGQFTLILIACAVMYLVLVGVTV
jgi:hypothetical protein